MEPPFTSQSSAPGAQGCVRSLDPPEKRPMESHSMRVRILSALGWAGTSLVFPILVLPLFVRDTTATGYFVSHGLVGLFIGGVVLRERMSGEGPSLDSD